MKRRIRSFIKKCAETRNLAVWENEAHTFRFQAVKTAYDGFSACRFSNDRLVASHSGMTLNEVVNLVAGWIDETMD